MACSRRRCCLATRWRTNGTKRSARVSRKRVWFLREHGSRGEPAIKISPPGRVVRMLSISGSVPPTRIYPLLSVPTLRKMPEKIEGLQSRKARSSLGLIDRIPTTPPGAILMDYMADSLWHGSGESHFVAGTASFNSKFGFSFMFSFKSTVLKSCEIAIFAMFSYNIATAMSVLIVMLITVPSSEFAHGGGPGGRTGIKVQFREGVVASSARRRGFCILSIDPSAGIWGLKRTDERTTKSEGRPVMSAGGYCGREAMSVPMYAYDPLFYFIRETEIDIKVQVEIKIDDPMSRIHTWST
ncbi:hypothetical protein FB451DRAFT_1187968 [Mycena latifolia]|nr:hypothetical protein FB451DRAFT_1187968 [Mycena latifolia]